jgi:hypothetical protein
MCARDSGCCSTVLCIRQHPGSPQKLTALSRDLHDSAVTTSNGLVASDLLCRHIISRPSSRVKLKHLVGRCYGLPKRFSIAHCPCLPATKHSPARYCSQINPKGNIFQSKPQHSRSSHSPALDCTIGCRESVSLCKIKPCQHGHRLLPGYRFAAEWNDRFG